ncbi:MAG: AAA domain-containing protein, partial [Candidatus Coatesbacteria bacterium]|nr:AAA domain-containing protein [Candidatus Coatesbacteria bacterium]
MRNNLPRLIALSLVGLLVPPAAVLLYRLGSGSPLLLAAAVLAPLLTALAYGAIRAVQAALPGGLAKTARLRVVGEKMVYQLRTGALEAFVKPRLGVALQFCVTAAVLLPALLWTPVEGLAGLGLWFWGAEFPLGGGAVVTAALLVAVGLSLAMVLTLGARRDIVRRVEGRLARLLEERSEPLSRRFQKLYQLEESCVRLYGEMGIKAGDERSRRISGLLDLNDGGIPPDETALINLLEVFREEARIELRELRTCRKEYGAAEKLMAEAGNPGTDVSGIYLRRMLGEAGSLLEQKNWEGYRRRVAQIIKNHHKRLKMGNKRKSGRKPGRGKGDKPELRSPRRIKEYLDDYIIGQEEAKRMVAIAVANHLQRQVYDGPVELDKSNIMLIGPTGCGKTQLVKSLARMLDSPIVITEATALTETGYVGRSVEDVIYDLYIAADRNLEAASRGIVYIDEIDKLSHAGGFSRDIGGLSVQQSLLTMVEGSEVSFPENGNLRFHTNFIKLDTRGVLFICGGAFSGLDELRRADNRPKLGFGGVEAGNACQQQPIQPSHLIEYGLLPEFIGRFPVITELLELNVDQLTGILGGVKNSILEQHQALMAQQGAQLVISEKTLRAIAELAHAKKLGVRGARGIFERLLAKHYYEL